MKNKKLISSVFILGTVFGAVASEQLSNGLYKFQAGDSISSQEVNHNFEHLQNQILEQKAYSVAIGWELGCSGDQGGIGNIELGHNNAVIRNDLYVANGTATEWSYNLETNTYTFNTSPEIEVKILPNYGDSTYRVKIEPLDGNLETFKCYKV
ncbi:MAG: hypothetical protein OXE99_03910 [Cellvibrionales bacterium]|nr:hypothetical protein [Cellvibrionales bacterium]